MVGVDIVPLEWRGSLKLQDFFSFFGLWLDGYSLFCPPASACFTLPGSPLPHIAEPSTCLASRSRQWHDVMIDAPKFRDVTWRSCELIWTPGILCVSWLLFLIWSKSTTCVTHPRWLHRECSGNRWSDLVFPLTLERFVCLPQKKDCQGAPEPTLSFQTPVFNVLVKDWRSSRVVLWPWPSNAEI